MKLVKRKNATDLLIRGVIGGGVGLFVSQITVALFSILLFLYGESLNSLPPIKWIFDHTYVFFVWYGTLTIGGFIWGITTKRF